MPSRARPQPRAKITQPRWLASRSRRFFEEHSVSESVVLKASSGKAFRLRAGTCATVTNTYGQQVVDTWALSSADPEEVLSMEHTRSCLDKITPRAGDNLFTNRRRPILHLATDSSPGIHDTLLSACDEERYRLLGFEGKHRSCTENFHSALAELGIAAPRIPSPWNLFENVRMDDNGML